MLEATADANNRNAYDISIMSYKSTMSNAAGPAAAFVKVYHNLLHHMKIEY